MGLKHIKTLFEDYYIDDNGFLQGLFKMYHENGGISIICVVKDGLMEGEFKSYYNSGGIWSIKNYVNGLRQGEIRDYHKNGELWTIYNCVNNEMHGFKYDYDVNGKLLKKRLYSMGVEIDVSIHGMDINNLTDNDINMLLVLYGDFKIW